MTTIWLATLVLAASPDLPSAAQTAASVSQAAASQPETAQQLRRRVGEVLRREATTTGAANRAAIRELVALVGQLESDQLLAVDERKRLGGSVRIRLERVAQRLTREIPRANGAAKAADRVGAHPQTIELADALRHVLAQQLQPLGQNMAQRPDAASRGEALLELIKTTIRPETWEEQGGPGRAMMFRLGMLPQRLPSSQGVAAGSGPAAEDHLAAAGGAAEDDGPALVELIQQTIAPHTWDVVGGPGSILYFRPLRVLVVRQTAEIHDWVGDVVGQLRQAGN